MSRVKNRRLMGQMNVVPYIDVMLVLLIIFMITAPMLQQGITVDLPEVDASPLDPETLQDNEPLILSIDAAGQYFVNLGETPDDPVDAERVRDVTAAIIRRNSATPVLIKADKRVPFEQVAIGLVLLQQAGATGIGILTDPVEDVPE
ncbi:MAG: ExbD/TolR family protein [Gammaproteobacteria bacterium]|nr:ExbD/TolR family protein [Gammaproteobacteria bacterium]